MLSKVEAPETVGELFKTISAFELLTETDAAAIVPKFALEDSLTVNAP